MGIKRIYLDTCVVIYIVEKQSEFADKVETAMSSLDEIDYCYSHLALLEALVKPIRTNDDQLKRLFELFFGEQKLLEMPKEVFETAAELRADHLTLKTPDALHLATAIYHNCDEFWTNDIRLNKVAPTLVKDIVNN